MNAIKNITIGHTERLYKPVGYTMLANLVNIVPFCLSIEAIRVIFNAFDGSGQPLDTTRLWWIFGVMAIYMLVMALAERASYRANFRGAYEMSASGRLSLAEHLRKLSLGFLSRRDPGDLSSILRRPCPPFVERRQLQPLSGRPLLRQRKGARPALGLLPFPV